MPNSWLLFQPIPEYSGAESGDGPNSDDEDEQVTTPVAKAKEEVTEQQTEAPIVVKLNKKAGESTIKFENDPNPSKGTAIFTNLTLLALAAVVSLRLNLCSV